MTSVKRLALEYSKMIFYIPFCTLLDRMDLVYTLSHTCERFETAHKLCYTCTEYNFSNEGIRLPIKYHLIQLPFPGLDRRSTRNIHTDPASDRI